MKESLLEPPSGMRENRAVGRRGPPRRGFERSERYRFSVGQGAQRALIEKSVTYFLAGRSRRSAHLAQGAHEYAWVDVDEAYRRIRYKERRKILDDAARAAGCPRPSASVRDQLSKS